MAKKKEQNTEETEIQVEKNDQEAQEQASEESTLRDAEVRIAELEKALAESTAKQAETEDRLLRILAEYDNFKKRSAREKEEIHFLAKSDLIGKLLPVFDNFERAQNFSNAEDYAAGVDMIIAQFFQILESLDVRSIAKEGDAFDPNFHEAVLREEKEGAEENTVTEVLQKGYAVGDKVIRHAMVKVSM